MKRWHCDAHADQAAPGDLDPSPSGIGSNMSPIPDPDEVARERRRNEQRAEEDWQRREERELRAREAREVARVREEQLQRELFGGQL